MPVLGSLGAGAARNFGLLGGSAAGEGGNSFIAPGTSYSGMKVFNSGRGLWLSDPSILAYGGGGISFSNGITGYRSQNSANFIIPSGLNYVYAILIGGGGGGNGQSVGWGGSGAGWIFAKLNLAGMTGSSLSITSGAGGSQNAGGSATSISGSNISMLAGGGVQSGTASTFSGGQGSSSGTAVKYAAPFNGGGTTSGTGLTGATGGGARGYESGGNSNKPWGSGGSGGDGSGTPPGGNFFWNYNETWNTDPDLGINPLTQNIVNSLYQSSSFFGDRNSSNYGVGNTGRPSTGVDNTPAGFFGAGGGGSGSGAGFAGGPGLVAIWW